MSDEASRLREALLALRGMRARLEQLERARTEPIAIVGTGCRFPGAADAASFWRLLRNGIDAIADVPADRWDAQRYTGDGPGRMPVAKGGFVGDVARFDPFFFGISPREAAAMDPQQRLVLEVAWEALEDAGIVPASLAGTRTGVFLGIGLNDYGRLQVPGQERDPSRIDTYSVSGNALCIAANRLSYLLDLQGPSMAIDTACSSSLVAVHTAVQSIRAGDSAVALAGGVNLMLAPANGIGIAAFLAPDGRCKAFDARANGYVRGEGAGWVVLKPLSRAIADGDRIYALIRGSAVNQDGFSSGLTVPNGAAQEALLRHALANAGVAAADIGYIEAHGTGTALGDPIEANALAAVLSEGRSADRPCALGSVKTNIGHLEAAAGIAGLIKTALALHHGEIPPSLHYETPNPHIPFDTIPLVVQRTCGPWPEADVRRAGVSSFGFGGTNAHVVLEAAPSSPERAADGRGAELLALSARSTTSLARLVHAWSALLLERSDDPVRPMCATAALRREHHSHRIAVVGRTADELRERLVAAHADAGAAEVAPIATRPAIAFVFSGQGPQWWAMARELLASEPVFRDVVEACDAALRPLAGWSLLEALAADEASSRLDQTEVAQPALFAVQAALAALWRSWGVVPTAVVGHSVGEIAAAYVADAITLEDAIRIVYHRGRLMQRASGRGRMASVTLSTDDAAAAVGTRADRVAIAAVNAPVSVVLSGDAEPIDEILGELAARDVATRMLPVTYAFHSPQMRPFEPELVSALDGLSPSATTVRLLSTVTGDDVDGRAVDARYWGRNMVSPVRFRDTIERLLADGVGTFLEMAPHPVLGSSIAATADAAGTPVTVLASLRRGRDDRETLLGALGALYVAGQRVEWSSLHAASDPWVRTPTYAWDNERYWILDDHVEETRSADAVTALPPAIAFAALLGEPVRSPAFDGTIFTTTLNADSTPLLSDHRIRGIAVLPAAGTVALALAAARRVAGEGWDRVEQFALHHPFTVPTDRSRALQLVLTPAGDDVLSVRVYRAPDAASDRSAWALHAEGRVVRTPHRGEAPAAFRVPAVQGNTRIGAAEHYGAIESRGLAFGPSLRRIIEVAADGDTAVGRLAAVRPNGAGPDADAELATLLDGGLQALDVLLARESVLHLPVAFESIEIHSDAAGETRAFARLRPGGGETGETVTADVDIVRADGTRVLQVTGVVLKRATATALAAIGDDAKDDWHHAVVWVSRRLPAREVVATVPFASREPCGDGPTVCDGDAPASAGRWLLLGDGGIADALADALRERCADVVHDSLNLTDVRPDRLNVRRALRAAGRVRGIVHLAALDGEADAGPSAAAEANCARLLHLVQAIGETGGKAARLFVVTRGAQAVHDGTADPAQAALWGLAAVADAEHPELRCTCVDIDGSGAAVASLCEELLADADDVRVLLCAGERRVQQLEAVRDDAAGEDDRPVQLDVVSRGMLDGVAIVPSLRRAPDPGEVEIRVACTGLNFRDVLNVLGRYPGNTPALGSECSGTVTRVGSGVTNVREGDFVIAVTPDGAFSSFVTVPSSLVARAPRDISAEAAATLPIAFLTAAFALERLAAVKNGDRVLVHSAAGGVGHAALQIALRAGAEVYGTAGTDDKRAYLRELGVHHVFDSRTLDFADEMLCCTSGRGVDTVLNSLAGDFIGASLRVLAPGGCFVELGKTAIMTAAEVAMLRPDVSYHVLDVGTQCSNAPTEASSMLCSIVAAVEAGTLEPLPVRTFTLANAASAMRFMAQAKHTGKIVVRQPGASAFAVRPDGAYLVTGGLGALGLAVTRWLVERGAGTVVLLSRSAPGPAATDAITALRDAGADVRIQRGDVSHDADVRAALATADGSGRSLRGVVHAAGVTGDGALVGLTRERVASVLAPKVTGGVHLDRLTSDRALDFFVLFSSIAPLVGSPGQAAYAAANAFLDALAHDRRARGLPATSISWGPWADAGMFARLPAAERERWTARGIQPLATADALTMLEALLRRDVTHAAAVRLSRSGSATATLLRSRATTSVPGDATASTERVPLAQRLRTLSPAAKRRLLTAHVREQIARVLGLPANHRLDPRQGLREIGMDSLMAVELRNRLQRTTGIALASTVAFDHPTLAALCDHLADVLGLNGAGVARADGRPEPDNDEAALLAELDALKHAFARRGSSGE